MKIDRFEVSPTVVFWGILLLILNIFDAFATLRHLTYGADEVNPFMNYLLNIGPAIFVIAKFLMVAAGMIFIVAYSKKAKYILPAVCSVYLLLACYHIILFVKF